MLNVLQLEKVETMAIGHERASHCCYYWHTHFRQQWHFHYLLQIKKKSARVLNFVGSCEYGGNIWIDTSHFLETTMLSWRDWWRTWDGLGPVAVSRSISFRNCSPGVVRSIRILDNDHLIKSVKGNKTNIFFLNPAQNTRISDLWDCHRFLLNLILNVL